MIVARHGGGVALQRRVRDNADRAAGGRDDIDIEIHFARGRVRVFADRSGVHIARTARIRTGRVRRIDVAAVLVEHAADRSEHRADVAVEILLGNIHAEHGDQRQQEQDQAPEEDRRPLAALFGHVVVFFFVVVLVVVVLVAFVLVVGLVAAGSLGGRALGELLRGVVLLFLVVVILVVKVFSGGLTGGSGFGGGAGRHGGRSRFRLRRALAAIRAERRAGHRRLTAVRAEGRHGVGRRARGNRGP